MSKKTIIAIIIVIAVSIIAGFSVWFFNTTKKITTYEECIKAGWLIRSRSISDGLPLFPNKYECILWSGKSFVKEEKIPQPSDSPNTEYSRTELLEDCANAEIPLTGERNTVYDSKKKTLEVRFWNGELQEDVLVILPYEPETDFAGCSDSAKDILRHVQELNEENIRSGLE